jgi:transcriptional regulator with XRE-family HTH domain
MNNINMAEFIAEQRKSKRMTQKELAQRLGITDKAVSKWERGLSCPDISLLTELSDALEVSVSELLNGSKAGSSSEDSAVEAIAQTTLQYANTVTERKTKNIRLALTVTISMLSFLVIIVCIICNYAIAGRLTWSLYPVSSLVYFWLIIMPAIVSSKRGVLGSIMLISLFTIPFLFVLESIIGIKGLIMPIATPICIVAFFYLWVAYVLIGRTKWPKYITIAATLLIGLPLSFGINYIISWYTGEPLIDIWDILGYVILLVISVLILGCGYIRNRCVR